jgi:deaminated glutathione amidase
VLVPSAFMATTGAAHWEVLLRARAIECQVWIGAAAQTGVHRGGRQSYGRSMIVDPWGVVVCDAGEAEGCVVSADIDVHLVDETRHRMPVAQHRRADIGNVEVFER